MSSSQYDEDPGEREITLGEAMRTILADKAISDVTLLGTDLVEVFANRGLLAARSKVLREILFDEFAEARESPVWVGYRGDVLRSITEYCYTNDAEILLSASPCDERSARSILSLADAACTLELPGLYRKTRKRACSVMEQQPPLAWVILDECKVLGVTPVGIAEHALQAVRSKPSSVLEGNVIASISAPLLEDVLRDDKVAGDQYTLFLILKEWADADVDDSEASTDECSFDSGREYRHEIAARLTAYLSLEEIDASQLCTSVALSGLVTGAQLLEAYKTQALEAERRHVVYSKEPGYSQSVWQSSDENVFNCQSLEHWVELLRCKVLDPLCTSGESKWKALEMVCG